MLEFLETIIKKWGCTGIGKLTPKLEKIQANNTPTLSAPFHKTQKYIIKIIY